MGIQTKIILAILAILVAAGIAGLGVYYGMKPPAEPQMATQPPAAGKSETETPAAPGVAPSFDIVRVEPSGEVVAAGRAAPGARVDLLLGDEVVATAEASADGEWALVLDKPLAPGSYDLALRATDAGGAVDGDRVAVVIEAPDKTPLVAVTRPGQPTEVLQKPEETVVAAAPEAQQPAPSQSQQQAASEPQQQAKPEPQQPAADTAASQPAEPAQGSQQAAAEQPTAPASGEQATSQQQAEASQPAVPQPAGTETARQRPEETAAGQPALQETAAETQVAATESATTQPPQATEQSQAAPASSGAQQDQAAPQPTTAPTPPAQTAPSQAPTSQAPEAQVAIETVEVEDPDRLMLSGSADAGEAVRLYLNNKRIADVKTGTDGRWSLTAVHPMTPGRYEVRADVLGSSGQVRGRAEVRFDRVQLVAEAKQPAAAAPAASAPETASQGSVTPEPSPGVTIVARSGGTGSAASGEAVGSGADANVVVIARGDSLWRIARKIYGRGIRHTEIYEANRKQIRDPNLIYPGQVFTIPVPEDNNPNG